jgi:signal transduction histidine kinase
VSTALARLGADRTDAALALVLTTLGLVQVSVWPIAPGPLGQIFVLVSTLPLAWRRTRPVISSLVSTLVWPVPLDGFPVLGFVVMILQFFALGSRGRPRGVVAGMTGWAVLASVVGTLLGPEAPVAAIGGALAVAAPVLAGQLVAHLGHQNAELARLSASLRLERERAEEAAVEEERSRIAQELHDVVGHEVTLIAVQAEAASAALRVAPERALAPVEAIRVTAHRTLSEIRGVLDVVSPRGGGPSGTDDLTDLASRADQAGIDSELVVTGTAPEEQHQARLAVNRIVRECLTNAGRHASGERVRIEVAWEQRRVLIRAVNRARTATAPVPGRGLTGMRHRAALLGGTFDVALRDGSFEVRVELPLVEAAR